MRLSDKEVALIKEVIGEKLENAQIYLFGSRLDLHGKGGDIDLFVVSETPDPETKLRIKARLKNLLHKPVDIVWHRNFDRPIEQEALKGVLL